MHKKLYNMANMANFAYNPSRMRGAGGGGLLKRLEDSRSARLMAEGIGGGLLFGATYGGLDYAMNRSKKQKEEGLDLGEATREGIAPEAIKSGVAAGVQGAGMITIGRMVARR